jgi:hypothetical protein
MFKRLTREGTWARPALSYFEYVVEDVVGDFESQEPREGDLAVSRRNRVATFVSPSKPAPSRVHGCALARERVFSWQGPSSPTFAPSKETI